MDYEILEGILEEITIGKLVLYWSSTSLPKENICMPTLQRVEWYFKLSVVMKTLEIVILLAIFSCKGPYLRI